MDTNTILRVRRLALAAQVAAGGPARPAQLARAGWTRSSSSAVAGSDADHFQAEPITSKPPRLTASIEPSTPDAVPTAGPLVTAFCAAVGCRVPPDAWFRARGIRSYTDAMKTRAARRRRRVSLPLHGTQEKD